MNDRLAESSADGAAPIVAGVEPASLDQIVLAVLAWQNQHPLAKRLGAESVHSVGWVAMPFLRSSQGEASSVPAWRKALSRWLKRGDSATPGAVAAFSESFIDGVKPNIAAQFALRHGIDALPPGDDWPQRRIAVDASASEGESAGWPFERWVASAALDGPSGRRRVLVGARAQGQALAVLGRRHWDRSRLALVGALLVGTLAAVVWSLQTPKPAAPEVRVAGPVLAASGVPLAPVLPTSAAASAAALPASTAASSPAWPASAPSAPEPAASSIAPAASADPPVSDGAALPRIDIRPRLGPLREGDRPRPPLRAAPESTPNSAAPASAPASVGADGKVSPPATPERVELRSISPGAATVALVSPGYAQRADAQAMLERMQQHLLATTGPGKALESAVFESPQGYRAAVWPFASREEAQLLNATMIARGWRTRAMDF